MQLFISSRQMGALVRERNNHSNRMVTGHNKEDTNGQ